MVGLIGIQKNDEFYMAEALKEAVKAFEEGEVPIGAVIVHEPPGENPRIIARAHNQVELLRDATAHAEMIAITQAEEHLENWRLQFCTIYVTVEPCMMCCGAMVLSRIKRLCYGARDEKAGAVESLGNLLAIPQLNHSIEVTAGIRQEECSQILSEFFQKVREGKRKS
ncbi:MAG: tRNA adenosine(34) deaminase TadA [bacterium]|nr:tRNA adenosine(34) deaminase TadA [bacterium]